MRNYLNALARIFLHGKDRMYRNGVARTLYGDPQTTFHHDLADGFPLLTTKKMAFKSIKGELLFFLSGSRDVRDAQLLGTNIWNANAIAPYWIERATFVGDLGRIYGVQWRHWQKPDGTETDQVKTVIDGIKNVLKDPNDALARRLIISAWNPGELDEMSLPPCHMLYQFDVDHTEQKLNVAMIQRSADFFLGVPFNIASTALLVSVCAHVTGLQPGTMTITYNNAHIYEEHFSVVRQQLLRELKPLPTLQLSAEVRELKEFKPGDIVLQGYTSDDALKGEMAV